MASLLTLSGDLAELERVTTEIEEFRRARRAKSTASLRRRREAERRNWPALEAWLFSSPADGLTLRPDAQTIIRACNPEQFEYLVAFLLSKEGWHAKVTPYVGDGGVDIELDREYPADGATQARQRGVVQVKHRAKDTWIEELTSFVNLARGRRASYALFVTSGSFHSKAWEYGTERVRLSIRFEIWWGGAVAERIAKLDDANAREMIAQLYAVQVPRRK